MPRAAERGISLFGECKIKDMNQSIRIKSGQQEKDHSISKQKQKTEEKAHQSTGKGFLYVCDANDQPTCEQREKDRDHDRHLDLHIGQSLKC